MSLGSELGVWQSRTTKMGFLLAFHETSIQKRGSNTKTHTSVSPKTSHLAQDLVLQARVLHDRKGLHNSTTLNLPVVSHTQTRMLEGKPLENSANVPA